MLKHHGTRTHAQSRISAALSILLLLLFVNPGVQAATRYKVEVLVFLQNGLEGNEQRPSDDPGTNTNGSVLPGAKGYVRLKPSTWALAGIEKKLSATSGYKPVYHAAWVQKVIADKKSRPVHIMGDDVDGTIRVDRGRYLHVRVDLQSGKYRMKQKRRMRSKETHYFDHPRLGVITRITPVKDSD